MWSFVVLILKTWELVYLVLYLEPEVAWLSYDSPSWMLIILILCGHQLLVKQRTKFGSSLRQLKNLYRHSVYQNHLLEGGSVSFCKILVWLSRRQPVKNAPEKSCWWLCCESCHRILWFLSAQSTVNLFVMKLVWANLIMTVLVSMCSFVLSRTC